MWSAIKQVSVNLKALKSYRMFFDDKDIKLDISNKNIYQTYKYLEIKLHILI